jgi:CelD/BcsL family acetyltransferase involved in cellulose biosynthesis
MTADEAPTGGLEVTAESLETLAPEWANLHAGVAGASPFLHPAWHETWLRHFAGDSPEPPAPVFLAARDGGELIGVAALDTRPGGHRQLGDPNVTDYAGILAELGREEDVAGLVLEWVAEDLASRLELWGLPADSPMRAALAAAGTSRGWSLEEAVEALAPRAALPGDWEAFVAALPKHDRHELRRKLRNLGAAGEVRFESATSPEDVKARFDRFFELMRISREDKDEFLTPRMEDFFRELGRRFAELGAARLSTLRVDGVPAAMVFCFEDADTTYLYNSGYDPAYAHLAVGLLSKAEAVRDAIARGKRTFDFLRGEEDYKRRLGGLPHDVLTLRLTRES